MRWLMVLGMAGWWTLAGAGGAAAAEALHAYVGAGLRPPVEQLINAFKAESGIAIEAEYGGSGQLLARIAETGRGDLFLSGSTVFTDQLAAQGGVAYLRPLVLHGPVLALTPAKAGEIHELADLARPGLKVGLGDPQAMALGRTAEQILERSGLGPAIRPNVVVRAATVKQLTLYLLEGTIDAAIIGAADAAQNPGQLVLLTLPPAWYQAEVAPVAVLKVSTQPEAARRFADFLATPAALTVFQHYGFPPAP